MTYNSKDLEKMNGTTGTMNRDQFMNYISENFSLDGTTMRLIDDILFYAESRFETRSDRIICLTDLLSGIGLTHDEILMFN